MTHEELLKLREQAQVEMQQTYPGVHGVGIGYRVRGGQLTDEVVLRVYVLAKKPLSALRPEEIIPPTYNGVGIDVNEVQPRRNIGETTPCANHHQYDPLVGGITISAMNLDAAGLGFESGTLGFFVTINGLMPPRNIGLVTCAHIVNDAHVGVGATFYEPGWVQGLVQDPNDSSWYPTPRNAGPPNPQAKSIGPVLRLPAIGSNGSGFYIDCALIQLDFCISSCCNSNCGISFKNEIVGLNLPSGSSAIADVNLDATTIRMGDTVYKVGRASGRTVGKVSAVMLPDPVIPNAFSFEIKPQSMQDASNCGGLLRVAQKGDSGAAVIDADGKLIGLLYSVDNLTGTLGYACYIAPVLTALDAVAITTANPVHGNPAAQGMMLELPAVIDGKPNMTPRLRARVLASEQGRQFWGLVELHRLEAQQLVNRNRRVTVAWHRHKGPQFLNRLIANARDPEQLIPREIEGVTREALLRAMANAFREHGSAALREVVERYLDEALALVGAGDDLHLLVEFLDERKTA